MTPNYAVPCTESEYARYAKEHQRPALLEAIRERVLAGSDARSVIRDITLSPLDGARSVSAVLHGRLATTVRPDAPVSWSARTPESAGEIAQATAEALDARTAALGERQLAQPEPWVMRHLGPPPRESKPGLQALLQADYARRAGIAASYREAAGITDPHQVIRWEGHKGNPELEAMRHDAIFALQIHDEQADLAGMDRGQLEAKVIAGARARAAAPRDVSAELRATAQAETDMQDHGRAGASGRRRPGYLRSGGGGAGGAAGGTGRGQRRIRDVVRVDSGHPGHRGQGTARA